MCGRYSLGGEDLLQEMREIIHEVNRRALGDGVKSSGEAYPSDTVPVIATSRGMRPGIFPMRWGYLLPDGKRIINARSETAASKPLFQDGIRRRRCVIPAVHYFEWTHGGQPRARYAIAPREGMTFLAGVYRMEGDTPAFAILTRGAAEEIAFVHDRMPVMLPRELIEAWIDPASDPAPLLERAVTQVRYARDASDEQLSMELPGLEL